jgi:hypothetical protein
VQCAREYEGKGAYPNYIANGVIDGFEEHRLNPTPGKFHNIGDFARQSPLFAGIWTWSRGGGWDGPYIKNELWCELNAWVMAQWAAAPRQSEESVFYRYTRARLQLDDADAKKFRQLCLLSAEAVLRGKTGRQASLNPRWSRDDGINRPMLPAQPSQRRLLVEDQREAVRLWEQIVKLADEIHFPDAAVAEYVRVSSRYGLDLYRIYAAYIELNVVGIDGDRTNLSRLLASYDQAWADYRKLAADHRAACATLYNERSARFGRGDGVDNVIEEFRAAVGDPTNTKSASR